MHRGYIKIYRKTLDHWIFKNEKYLKAWLIMMLEANIKDNVDLIDGELIECKRGEKLYSLNTWCEKFGKNWSIQQVRTFFKLLENDYMILQKGMRKTTRITICNYDSYQSCQQTDNRELTHKQQGANSHITTIKECKNDKNANNNNILSDFFEKTQNYYAEGVLKNENIEKIYSLYPTSCHISKRSTGKNKKNKDQIKKLLETKTFDDIKEIIDAYIHNCKQTKTYIKNFGTFLNQFPEKEDMKKYESPLDVMIREAKEKNGENLK